MDILAIVSEEVKEIFSSVICDDSVSLEMLERDVFRCGTAVGSEGVRRVFLSKGD